MITRNIAVWIAGLIAIAVLPGCGSSPQSSNVLLIIAADVGAERIGAYSSHGGPTPHIDRLAAESVVFTNTWSNPMCSSARAAILTGKYGFRTGAGRIYSQAAEFALEPGVTIPRALPDHTSVALGKWHLAGSPERYAQHPRAVGGFAAFLGNMHFLYPGYSKWKKHFMIADQPERIEKDWSLYATRDTADDTIEQIRTLGEPWFLWVAFNATHSPLHVPPDELYELTSAPRSFEEWSRFRMSQAMIESMDQEIGRILAALDEERLADRTTVIFLSDNGSLGWMHDGRGKQSMYEPGINVPLIIRGPEVRTPGISRALVNTTDLFATIVELGSGVKVPVQDSISLVPYLRHPKQRPLREFTYSEMFSPNGHSTPENYEQAIRGTRFKLIRRDCRHDELYDLRKDPAEKNDLLLSESLEALAAAAYRHLDRQLLVLLEDRPCQVI